MHVHPLVSIATFIPCTYVCIYISRYVCRGVNKAGTQEVLKMCIILRIGKPCLYQFPEKWRVKIIFLSAQPYIINLKQIHALYHMHSCVHQQVWPSRHSYHFISVHYWNIYVQVHITLFVMQLHTYMRMHVCNMHTQTCCLCTVSHTYTCMVWTECTLTLPLINSHWTGHSILTL